MKVRLTRDGALYAITTVDGLWLAGFISDANRALYLSWWPGWDVVG